MERPRSALRDHLRHRRQILGLVATGLLLGACGGAASGGSPASESARRSGATDATAGDVASRVLGVPDSVVNAEFGQQGASPDEFDTIDADPVVVAPNAAWDTRVIWIGSACAGTQTVVVDVVADQRLVRVLVDDGATDEPYEAVGIGRAVNLRFADALVDYDVEADKLTPLHRLEPQSSEP